MGSGVFSQRWERDENIPRWEYLSEHPLPSPSLGSGGESFDPAETWSTLCFPCPHSASP